MRSFPFALLATALAACGGESEPPRLLVVGWDGASYRMVDALLEQGELPNVERLLRRGASAALESTIIPISSAAWTGAVTGKGPGETGVYGFFEPIEGSYDVRLISSRSNRATPIWRILTRNGLRSIVFGVPITYPPEPILGTMVTGMLSPFRATYTWPPELADELRRRNFEPDLEVWREARTVGWDDLERQLQIKEEVVLELLADDDWRFAMVVFKSLDVVSHLAYEVDFAAHVTPVYRRLDAILGHLLDAVGDDTNVLLLSDHGFNTYSSGLNLHAWLVDRGHSVRKESVKRFQIDPNATLERRGRQEVLQIRNELDWSRTVAFAANTEGNFGGIRLNVAGREPEGIVPPEDVDSLLDRIEADLRALVTDDGTPLVTRILRAATLYPGPHRAAIPDLLFETPPDRQVFADPEEPRILGPYGTVVPDHDLLGILIAAGPSITHRRDRGRAHVFDLAPTALHLLAQPVYAEMHGQALTELLRAPTPPIVIAETDDPSLRTAPGGTDAPFTPEELRELEDRLRALGYTDD